MRGAVVTAALTVLAASVAPFGEALPGARLGGTWASTDERVEDGNDYQDVILLTGYAGNFGVATLAGYGVGARLEYVLIPLVLGFGAALVSLVSMVGRNIGAGQLVRAARIAWVGALLMGAVTGMIGTLLALARLSQNPLHNAT